MQTIERNSLIQNLNSIKIDLKLIALGSPKVNQTGNKDALNAVNQETVHRSPKK